MTESSNMLGIGVTPASILHIYPTNSVGINVKLYEYTTLGSTWGGWSTVLGFNAGAAQTTTNEMVTLLNTTSTSQWGASAIKMSNEGIAFHSVPGPVTQGTFNSQRMLITPSGTVGIGTSSPDTNYKLDVNGSIHATGVIGAQYQDVAEWVPATSQMTPGTVVVLNRDRNNEVMPSARSYDTAVAGVVSERPGVILGVASASKAAIATTGRVKVHVDATAGAIAVGDLLVTSDKSGTAMKSQPVDLGGIAIHRPGTVIGKALEPLPNGEGEILVLLSLQ
jgi:hypothetical protein